MIPTEAELALLRTHPQETELWLSIYKPPVVLACQLVHTGSSAGYHELSYDNITEGSYASVESGMTMYVGTTSGAKDKGRIRVKSANASFIEIAECSDIDWEDNLYLTIIRFWEIDAIYPRITSTGTDTYWYKDYDIEYVDQNDKLGTFICMGPHFAGFIDEDTGYCPVWYSASGTHSLLGSDPLSYDWWFQGTVGITGSYNMIVGNMAYFTPGQYTTRLKVTDSNGVVDISYRHISIYERPGKGSNVPILNWNLISLDGDRESGGWSARIKVRENISDVVDGALVVIFADDRYGTTKQSIGGNAAYRNKTVFVGYIIDDSISYNYQDSSVEFEVGSPTEVMKLAEGFSVAVNSSTDPSGQAASDEEIPSAWVLVKDMDCRRAIYHYLRWHSTVLFTNDFEFRGTDRSIEYFDASRASLYDAIYTLMKGTLYGNVCCDRQGKIWAEVDIAATPNALTWGTFPRTIIMDNQDWIGTPVIDEMMNKEISYLEMGGIYFDPASGTSTAYMACAPGDAPSYRGKVQRTQGLALASQAQLNELTGNIFAYLNARYPDVQFKMSGNYRIFDLAPLEITKISLKETDTPKGIVWSQKYFHPISQSFEYDSKQGMLLSTLNFHEVTTGTSAQTMEIPPMPPEEDTGGGGYDQPPIWTPPIYTPPVIPTAAVIQFLPIYMYHPFGGVGTLMGAGEPAPDTSHYMIDMGFMALKSATNVQVHIWFQPTDTGHGPVFYSILCDLYHYCDESFYDYQSVTNFELTPNTCEGSPTPIWADCLVMTLPQVTAGDMLEFIFHHDDETSNPNRYPFYSPGMYLYYP